MVTVGWRRDDHKVDEARIEHFSRIGESFDGRRKLSRGRDAIGVDVTHSGQFEARGALHGKVVLVADCAVCEKTNANVCEIVARRHWLRLYGVRKSF
jgi:hypothetical protein